MSGAQLLGAMSTLDTSGGVINYASPASNIQQESASVNPVDRWFEIGGHSGMPAASSA
jgi:hypothetical protein